MGVRTVHAPADRADEALEEEAFLTLVRASFLARLLSLVLAVLFVPPDSVWVVLAVLALGFVSLAGSRSARLPRAMVRHPLLGTADAVLTVATLWLVGLDSPVVYSSVCTAVIVGLVFPTRYVWPLLLILVAGTVGLASSGIGDSDAATRQLVLTGVPALYVGLAVVGWAARRGHTSSHRSRAEAAAALAEARAADERARLARDMHDSLGKTLHGIGLAASALPDTVSRDPSAARELAAGLSSAAGQAADEARAILLDLRADQNDRPLAVLLGELCRTWSDRTGVPVSLQTDGVVDVDPGVSEQLTSNAAEALHNVAKHADADSVQVRLWRQRGAIHLSVADDGVGFDTETVARREDDGHFGLRGMRERAEDVRAEMWLRSEPDEGTSVTWVAPQP